MYCMHNIFLKSIISFLSLPFLSAKQRELNLNLNFMGGEGRKRGEVEGEGAANCFAKGLWAEAMLLFENVDTYPVTANVEYNILVMIYERACIISHDENMKFWNDEKLLEHPLQHVWSCAHSL